MFTITDNSFVKLSIPAVPATFIPFAPFILFIILFALSLFKNALQVIVLVPSYKSKLNNVFPDFNVLSSEYITSPCNATFPSSTPRSWTFTNGSVIFSVFPKIIGVSSLSSGNSGTSIFDFAIVFAITVISPAYVSNPALPIAFTVLASWIFSIISCPSFKSFANDFTVINPVPS